MILVKHLMDPAEPEDGLRAWVETDGLTKDLQEWCAVETVLDRLGPPRRLAEWFERHPEGYDNFLEVYHRHLDQSPHRGLMEELAKLGRTSNVTLLHSGDDAAHNTATALFAYITELSAYLPGEA